MFQKPRPFTTAFFSWKELATSVFQGLAITAGTLFIYQYSVQQGFDETHTRTMVFSVLITANIFLTLVNRSFYYSIFTTLKYKNKMVLFIIALTTILTGLLLYIPTLAEFFEFTSLNYSDLLASFGIGALSVLWYEFVKYYSRRKKK